MLADERDGRAGRCQNLRAQQSEFAVARYRNSCDLCDRNALQNSTSGGQRFGEHRALIRNLVGHRQQVSRRQFQKLCMRAVASDDSQHCSIRTMTRIAGETKLASATAGVDLTDDALTIFSHADKFVTECSFKSGINAPAFQIGITDSQKRPSHHRSAVTARLLPTRKTSSLD